jgi:hypothetical protein
MAAPLKTSKKTVELNQPERVSRIRRDPVPVQQVAAEAERKLHWRSSEREIWIALIGIVAFALAIDVIAVAIATYWN